MSVVEASSFRSPEPQTRNRCRQKKPEPLSLAVTSGAQAQGSSAHRVAPGGHVCRAHSRGPYFAYIMLEHVYMYMYVYICIYR